MATINGRTTPPLVVRSTANGRLTLASLTPITTTDQTAKTTVYFTPYKGNQIGLYNGSVWSLINFAEVSVAVPGTTVTPFDIFAYDNAGTLALETVNWTNDTTRATALVLQDGVLVKSGATTRRYLGTGRTTGVSGQTEDSAANRFLWNYYNRVRRYLSVVDTTDSWTYTTATWRQANGAAANQVNFVLGVSEDAVEAQTRAIASNTLNYGLGTGVGADSTTVNSAQTGGMSGLTTARTLFGSSYFGYLAAGYHYLAWLEYSIASGVTTWYGDVGEVYIQTGLTANIWG